MIILICRSTPTSSTDVPISVETHSMPIKIKTPRHYSLEALYHGDNLNLGSVSPCEPFEAKHFASVKVTPDDTTVTLGKPVKYSALVANSAPYSLHPSIREAPLGQLKWSDSNMGGGFGFDTCRLREILATNPQVPVLHKFSATCNMIYTPLVPGSITITATYPGSVTNTPATGNASLTVVPVPRP